MQRIEVTNVFEFKDQHTSFNESLHTYDFVVNVKVKCPKGIRNSKKTIKDLLKTSLTARQYFTGLCLRNLNTNIASYDTNSWAYPVIEGNSLKLHVHIRKGMTRVDNIQDVICNVLEKRLNI